jgi:hypothetical protein
MGNPLQASCEVLSRDAGQVILVGQELLEEATLRAETSQGTSKGTLSTAMWITCALVNR